MNLRKALQRAVFAEKPYRELKGYLLLGETLKASVCGRLRIGGKQRLSK